MKAHFVRDTDRPICNAIVNCKGVKKRCVFLQQNEDWYFCRAYGFRFEKTNRGGVCKSEKWRVFYDHEMLSQMKSAKYNFCGYRIVAPGLVTLMVIFSGGGALKLILMLIKAISA